MFTNFSNHYPQVVGKLLGTRNYLTFKNPCLSAKVESTHHTQMIKKYKLDICYLASLF